MKILIRYIVMFLSFFAFVMPIEQSVMASESSGPHIPAPKGDIIEGWSIAGMHITNTVFSTWIFMGVLFALVAFMYAAISTSSLPRLRAF
jgi:ABC-type xylose transport system permease subunit